MCPVWRNGCQLSFHLSSPKFAWSERWRRWAWLMLIMYFSMIWLIFFNLLLEIECIWCCLCRRALRFMSTHLMPQSLYLQPPVNYQSFAPSDLVQKMRHKCDFFLDKICIVTIIPSLHSSSMYLRRKSFRGTNKTGWPESIILMLDEAWPGTWTNSFFHWQ